MRKFNKLKEELLRKEQFFLVSLAASTARNRWIVHIGGAAVGLLAATAIE
jgi:hypothetical protein